MGGVREAGAPLSLTVIRRGVLSAHTQRNKALSLSYLGGPGMWKGLLSSSSSVGSLVSAQIASEIWGIQIWSELWFH